MLSLNELKALVKMNQPDEEKIFDYYIDNASGWSTVQKSTEKLLDGVKDTLRVNVTWKGSCEYGLKVNGGYKKTSGRKKIQAYFSLLEDIATKRQILDGHFMYAFELKLVDNWRRICESEEVRGLYENGVLRYFEMPDANLKVAYNKEGKLQTIFYKKDSYTYEATHLDEENPVLTVTAPNPNKGITVLTIKNGKREYKELPVPKKMFGNPKLMKAILKYGAIATAAAALFGAGRMTATTQIKTVPVQQHERG